MRFEDSPRYRGTLGFGIAQAPSFISIGFPHWLFSILVGLLAAFPWLRWRFSLRTLLILCTLIAVGLGLAVMMLKGS
jgi:hypothetical protein